MDADHFDAFVRALDVASRRRVFGLVSGLALGAAASLVGLADAAAGNNRRRRRRRRRKKPSLQLCPPEAPTPCGGSSCCPAANPLCCPAPPEVSAGFGCYEADRYCCPVEYGGSACKTHETCCPPPKGGYYPLCIDPALGYQCCPFNSGGAVGPGQQCCPPETTNDVNFGRCPSDQACCNTDTDCNEAAGEICHPSNKCCSA